MQVKFRSRHTIICTRPKPTSDIFFRTYTLPGFQLGLIKSIPFGSDRVGYPIGWAKIATASYCLHNTTICHIVNALATTMVPTIAILPPPSPLPHIHHTTTIIATFIVPPSYCHQHHHRLPYIYYNYHYVNCH